jgi:hypothetical protein
VLDFPLSFQAQAELFVDKAGHERQLFHYLIGSDFSFILWSEITMVYVKDVLKGLEEHSRVLTAGFINGLFSSVKGPMSEKPGLLLLETPFCEWERV